MPTVSANGTQLYYEIHGDGSPVILVPGLGGLGAYWRPQIASFSKRYRVVLYDHRGCGQSERTRIEYSEPVNKPRGRGAPRLRRGAPNDEGLGGRPEPPMYTVEQMAADTLGLMDALGLARAHVVGHSTGGAIGQILALEHPHRLASLVLANTWTKADHFFHWCFEVRKELLVKSGIAAYQHAAPLFLYPSWYISRHGERLRAEWAASVAGFTTVEIATRRIDAILAFDRSAKLGAVTTPTLVIGARDDVLTPAYFSEELARMIPGAKLVLLETGAHACSQTVPGEFDRHVLAFLDAADHGLAR